MDDDGFVLAESHAILKYLAEKHDWDDIYPSDARERARLDEYLFWHNRSIRELTLVYWRRLVHPEDHKKQPGNIVVAKKGLETLEVCSYAYA